MNTISVNQSAKARNSAILCLLLAVLTMATTAWFVVEGINATEPDSPARWAKVASGVLLLALEAAAFWLAGQWLEHKGVLRALGFGILALEITLMSVSQISIGMTAAKAASNGAGTIEEIRAQAKESREAAAALRADAANLRGSKHGWLKQQAGERSAAAAKQTESAAAAVASLEKHSAVQASTPIVEIVGQGGLIALSIALSVALSLSGIVLMHVAGSLWRRAGGALPIDVQILELLHRVHGVPAQIGAPAAPAPVLASYRPAGAVAPKDASTGFSYSSKAALAGAGLLAATAAPMAHAVPAVPAAAGEAKQPHPTAAKQSHLDGENQAHTGTAAAAELAGLSEAKQSHLTAAKPPHSAEAQQARTGTADAAELAGMGEAKPPHLDSASSSETGASRRAWSATVVPDGTKLDTGTTGKAATRYNRIKAAVKAGKLKPSMRAIQAAEGGGGVVVRAYLQQLETEGVTVRAGRGWVLASKGGAA